MRIYIKYFLALLLFGFNGIVASYISLNSYEIVFLRTLIGSVFLGIIFFCSKSKLQGIKNKKHFVYLIISGIAMGTSWMFLYEAYSQVGVSIATLAYYCGPIIVMLLSPFVFHERLTFSKISGFIFVLIGMYLVNGNDLRQNGFSWGLICGILSAIMYAFMVIFNKKALSITGLENSMFQLIFSFLTVMVFTWVKQGVIIPSLFENIVPVLILGIVNTGIGCYLYFSSIQKLPAGSVAICGYLEPLSALIFSAIFLSERLALLQIIGAGLIICGAAFGEFYTHKKISR
jgi:Predicted membrane protein